jgi:hypothetical protein
MVSFSTTRLSGALLCKIFRLSLLRLATIYQLSDILDHVIVSSISVQEV